MARHARHSMVLAADFRVDDPDRVWSILRSSHDQLASLGAHHVAQYASTYDAGRVLVTVGVHSREPVERVLRSPLVRQWFDAVGVEDLPPMFAGSVLEKVSTSAVSGSLPPGVVVAAMLEVDDPSTLHTKIQSGLDHLATRGVRKVWTYRAFDDVREVLVMMEVTDADVAREWIADIKLPDSWAVAGADGIYPEPFVGRLVDVMRVAGRG